MFLAAQNWDDHDRSNRYLTRSIAKAYLDSCPKNAILFANGDNDTFPLWYLQEVEGYRTDVRICNLSLMGTDWYIDQMKRKAYDGEPVKMNMTKEMYQQGTRDLLVARNSLKMPQNIVNVMQEIYKPTNNKREATIPTTALFMKVDKEKVLANGVVPESMADQIVDNIVWNMPNTSIYYAQGNDTVKVITKAYIAMMDILANNNWERPICYVATTGADAFFGLENYFQAEGMVYRLVPIYSNNDNMLRFVGRVDSDILYDNLMNKFELSEFASEDIFLSQDYTRMVSNFKIMFFRLVESLINEQKFDKAELAVDRVYECFPQNIIPYDYFDLFFARCYVLCNNDRAVKKGIALFNDYIEQLQRENAYYAKFKGNKAAFVSNEYNRNNSLLSEIYQHCNGFVHAEEYQKYQPDFQMLLEKISPTLANN